MASHPLLGSLGIPVAILHILQPFLIPLSYWHGIIVVVGAHEYQYGIEVVTMLFLQFVCLAWNVVPLSSADGIHKWFYAEPLLQ